MTSKACLSRPLDLELELELELELGSQALVFLYCLEMSVEVRSGCL